MNMKILGVLTSNIFQYKNQPVNAQKDYTAGRISFSGMQPSKDVFIKSQPTFGILRSAGDFRSLANTRTVHCLYCGRPMLSNKVAGRLKNTGIFSGSIKNFVQEMFNYLDYLHPTEKEALKKITMMTFDSPDIRLSEAIKRLYPEANKELLKEQKPILKEISALSDELPRGWKTKFNKLMRISRYRLEEKEYIPDEFSGKEFSYKIGRISDTIKDDYLAGRILKLAEPLTHPIFKSKDTPLNAKFVSKVLSMTETRDVNNMMVDKVYLQKLLIRQIAKYGEILNRKDLLNLCDTALKTIDRQPVKVKFSNKAFRYDLNEALEGMPDEGLRKRIDDIVKRLPNSQTSVNSFITKHENAASDAIGYDMLRPSLATIEHMHPKSLGGPDVLGNFALACGRDNNNRSSEDMHHFIEQFKQSNQQRYFMDIWQEVKRNNLPKNVFFKMVDTFVQESGRKIDTTKFK